MSMVTTSAQTVADVLIFLLKQRQVDYFFANVGTEYPPILESLQRSQAKGEIGQKTPIPIAVPHENVAVNMAYGYYLATGRPQAVMLHVNVGSANALCGLINACRANVPMLLIAGSPSVTEEGHLASKSRHIHWAQDTFNQAAMVREYVKWDYNLTSEDIPQLERVLDRGLEIATTEPKGPVYLKVTPEALSRSIPDGLFTYNSEPRTSPVSAIHPDPKTVEKIAMWLSQAHKPLIITGGASRNPEIFNMLTTLARDFSIPVVTFHTRNLQIATTHPMYIGSNPHAAIREADVIIALDVDAPWIPVQQTPPPDCKIIHVGPDPLFHRYPRRGFPNDLALRSEPALALAALHQALQANGSINGTTASERAKWVKELKTEAAKTREAHIRQAAESGTINFGWISKCINDVLDENTVVVREFDLQPDYLTREQPGEYYTQPPAGGLGWGLGTALGLKLAQPNKTIITAVGDGCYYFGNPTAAHSVASAHHLPSLTVIFNNAKWGTVVSATTEIYPNIDPTNVPLTCLGPHPNFEKVIEAFDGYGERVEHALDLPDALKRALFEVKEKNRQALLNVIC